MNYYIHEYPYELNLHPFVNRFCSKFTMAISQKMHGIRDIQIKGENLENSRILISTVGPIKHF